MNNDCQRLLDTGGEARSNAFMDFLGPWNSPGKSNILNEKYDFEMGRYFPSQEQTDANHVQDGVQNGGSHENNFHADYVRFPKTINKKQISKGSRDQQRLDPNAEEIELNLIFQRPVNYMKDIIKITLSVQRANPVLAAHRAAFHAGPVQLDSNMTIFFQHEVGSSKVVVKSHLDSVYEYNGYKVYKLSTGKSYYNEFQVLIEVHFHNGSKSVFTTEKFQVLGAKYNTGARKRFREDEAYSPRSNKYFKDPSESENFAHAQRIVTDLIEAAQGNIQNLYTKVIKSGNGDIAYHFVLKDQLCDEEIEPGEVIGFALDDNGKTVIHKLTLENAKHSFLKGVVTDSQYLECNKKDTEEKTATVCMLGLVRVNVIGPVSQGEGLYASPENPGTCISEQYLKRIPVCDEYELALVGHAFQKVECQDDEFHQVQSLVSLTDCAGHDLINRQLTGLESRLKIDMASTARKAKKKIKRCSIGWTAVILFLIAVAAFLIYQFTAPGSFFKYWKCRWDSNGGTAEYWYWLKGNELKGIEFNTCDHAWRKATDNKRFKRLPKTEKYKYKFDCLNGTYRYYINLDSCAGVLTTGARYMFAVNSDCSEAWQFDEMLGQWTREDRVCIYPKCNIKCSFKKNDLRRSNCDIDEQCKWNRPN